MKKYYVLILGLVLINTTQAQITLYGTTNTGGYGYSAGTIFSYDPITSGFVNLISFNGGDGEYPYGNLIEAFDGNLYGMAFQGGANGDGEIFEYNPATSTFTVIVDFTGYTGSCPGKFANASLLQASDSNFYGMTPEGGSPGIGNVFKYNPYSGIFTNLFDFTGTSGAYIGEVPNGSLIQVKNNGKLYGLTSQGGIYGKGNIFDYDPVTGVFTDLVDMTGLTGSYIGDYPNASLIQASDGNLYGMTAGPYPSGNGNIFKYNPYTNVYTDLIDFTGDSGAYPGKMPQGSLVQASDGSLYGMTLTQGVQGKGNMFKYDPVSGIYTDLVNFTGTTGPYIGYNPYGSLIQASDGNLYGMTSGAYVSYGNIFSFNPATLVYADLIDFTRNSGPYIGEFPFADLLEYKNILTETYNSKNSLKNISISPNLSAGIFYIAISHQLSAISQIEVFNVLGEKVYQSSYQPMANSYQLDLRSKSNGVYFYRVALESGEMLGQGKLIIQR